MKIAFVVSEFNFDVTSAMEQRARRHAEFLGVEVSHTVHVPGVFDMGPAIKRLLKRKDVEAVVVIGTVIKGDTGHDEIVAGAAARAASDLAIQFDKPVALGMTGPGMTRDQAFDRIDNARNAVEAAVRMVRALKDIGE
ncbi:MAG TPA: 6,7-dimethyl-8-ribityllumazine synthase [Candidatus Binataceae bacterium]|nr:6,7-dimethyl-8-ribityllumazine synthase [Candidatus Binataceae bacterium]